MDLVKSLKVAKNSKDCLELLSSVDKEVNGEDMRVAFRKLILRTAFHLAKTAEECEEVQRLAEEFAQKHDSAEDHGFAEIAKRAENQKPAPFLD